MNALYQVMPDLSADEYAELKADIASRGVMVPIEFDESGNVLDGHHRLKICTELGISDYPKVIRAGMTDQEKRTHARKLNMARRQLTQEQRRGLIREQLQETPEKSDRQIGRELGVAGNTVTTQRKEMERTAQIEQLTTTIGADGKERPRQVERRPATNPNSVAKKPTREPSRKPVTVFNPTRREEKAIQNPDVVEKMADTGKSVLAAEKQVRREEKEERKSYTLDSEIPDGLFSLYTADIRDGLPQIADNSVDYIITDPPYPKEYIPLYGNLSQLAVRVLKPGGSMLVMTGQSYLPDVVAELSKFMRYHWCLSYLTPGGQSPQLFHKRVNTFWKPVLWFVKGEYNGDYIGDVLKSPVNQNDKRFHEWGQSVGGMSDIVERFTNPGDTVLDPFLGGGTTGVVAVSMGRKFIGTDLEQKNVDISLHRIKEAYTLATSAK